jgi:hypothetical protein
VARRRWRARASRARTAARPALRTLRRGPRSRACSSRRPTGSATWS